MLILLSSALPHVISNSRFAKPRQTQLKLFTSQYAPPRHNRFASDRSAQLDDAAAQIQAFPFILF
jgi:hypothetical protein